MEVSPIKRLSTELILPNSLFSPSENESGEEDEASNASFQASLAGNTTRFFPYRLSLLLIVFFTSCNPWWLPFPLFAALSSVPSLAHDPETIFRTLCGSLCVYFGGVALGNLLWVVVLTKFSLSTKNRSFQTLFLLLKLMVAFFFLAVPQPGDPTFSDILFPLLAVMGFVDGSLQLLTSHALVAPLHGHFMEFDQSGVRLNNILCVIRGDLSSDWDSAALSLRAGSVWGGMFAGAVAGLLSGAFGQTLYIQFR